MTINHTLTDFILKVQKKLFNFVKQKSYHGQIYEISFTIFILLIF